MKVEKAIRLLSENYQPNDDILIEWWGKDVFDLDENNPISGRDWAAVVSKVEAWPNDYALENIYNDVVSTIEKIRRPKAE